MVTAIAFDALLRALATIALPCLQDVGEPDTVLTDLSLEELMSVEIEVTSVSKKPQTLTHAAAAVFVLTQDDLRRSGATSIPEALRLVPGLDVARVNANSWAISARGFNGQFANKLLVLIDGRSVYTPVFSGVYWDVQDLMLEDVERIEVIRGPGASLWGANAVNGVISIITKSAKQTEGGLISASAGSEGHAIVGVRYGLALSEKAWLRVFTKRARTTKDSTPSCPCATKTTGRRAAPAGASTGSRRRRTTSRSTATPTRDDSTDSSPRARRRRPFRR